jgi:hypothetical protein
LFTAGVDDAPGEGYFDLILGDNGAAGNARWAEALDTADNDAAVSAARVAGALM